jgi:hypothetical protein
VDHTACSVLSGQSTACESTSAHLVRHFAKTARENRAFQYFLTRVEGFRSGGLAQLAAELGYYDQPHLANEVAQFAAESLGRIVRRGLAEFSNTRCDCSRSPPSLWSSPHPWEARESFARDRFRLVDP